MTLTSAWLKENGIEHTVSPEGLISVPGNLDLMGTPTTSLGMLKTVGGYLDLSDTPITSLGMLKTVGGSLYLVNTQITSLGALKTVGGFLYLLGTPITSLGELTKVGGVSADGLDTYTIEAFKKMVAAYKKMDVMDAPRAHLRAEHPWQKKVCEEIMGAV